MPYIFTQDKMPDPNFYLSPENYAALIKTGEWRINDVPVAIASGIKSHFGNPTSFAIFSSGLSPEAASSDMPMFIAGIDWVRAENRRRVGEPELNVYHYLVGSSGSAGYPVYYCGHSGVLTPSGWATLDDLEVYSR